MAADPCVEIAAGSTIGREHRRLGCNNQDAWFVWQSPDLTAAVVCDGCGSSPHSEVGAQVGARLTALAIAQQPPAQARDLGSDRYWAAIGAAVLAQLESWAIALGGDRSQVARDYFLFAILAAVVTPEAVAIAHCGDGIVALNGRVTQLRFPGNAPPYLGYGLIAAEPPASGFQVQHCLPRAEGRSLLIGSDGVADWLAAEGRSLPGKTDAAGSLAQFWQQDRYFRNPDQVRRQLAIANRDFSAAGHLRQVGLLPDDTTLVVLRARSES